MLKVAHWLLLWLAVAPVPGLTADDAPYPASPVIARLTWSPQIVRLGQNTGDNWPATWGDDDALYTSWGDGDGFLHRKPALSLGFARITGEPPDRMKAEEIRSNLDTVMGGGQKGIKSSALLMAGNVLYMFVRNVIVDGDFRHSRLAWSMDRERTWTWADWHFFETFGCPEFVQFGANYRGARDEYVYLVSQDNNDPYRYSERVVMARVPQAKLADRNAYEFYAGRGPGGVPRWSRDITERKPIFTDPNGAQRVALTYNAGLKRYFLVTSIGTHGSATKLMHTGGLGIFDAPEPWGPWATVSYDRSWSGGRDLEYRLEEWTYHQKFPTRYMSTDGRTMWLLFSGRGPNYTFCLRKATLELVRAAGE